MDRSRRYAYLLIVISVAFSSFLVRLNNYMVNISLPTITRSFGITSGEASQIISSYLLIITTTLLLFGKLGDRIGLKRIFVAGYVIFTVGSLLCGWSHNINILIGSRFIQGIGSSMLLAVSFAIISHFLPAGNTGWAFGITSTASALGVATGAPIGGIVTGYLSWNWTFFINVPVGIVAIFVALKFIPDTDPSEDGRPRKKRGRSFDILGVLLSFSGLGLLLFGLNRGDEHGWLSPLITGSLFGAVLLLVIFVLWEKHHKDPLLDVGLFLNPRYTFALTATFLAYMLISGNAFLIPFYLEIVKGLNAQTAGMVLLVYSIIYVFLSPVAGKLSDRVSPPLLCSIAMVSATLCVTVFSFTLRQTGLTAVLTYLVWLALSFVLFFSPNNNQVMNYAPPNKKGISSGLFNTTTNLGMVFGVTVIETVFAAAAYGPKGPSAGASIKGLSAGSALNGFQYSYLAGALCCLLALVFSLLGKFGTAKR